MSVCLASHLRLLARSADTTLQPDVRLATDVPRMLSSRARFLNAGNRRLSGIDEGRVSLDTCLPVGVDLPTEKLAHLQKILESDFFRAVREVRDGLCFQSECVTGLICFLNFFSWSRMSGV